MNHLTLLFFNLLILTGCNYQATPVPDYDFSKGISEQVLRNYLSRAVTHAELCTAPIFVQDGKNLCYKDDERMLKNIGAKFIGRSFFRWGEESAFNDPEFLGYANRTINRLHAFDPDIIFQAAIFETVSTQVETIQVPEYVFRDFGLPLEDRNFSYNSMLSEDGNFVNWWGEGISVPDISKVESKLWLYFLATTYIKTGFEAIHWGQVALMAMNDPQLYHWNKLLEMIRTYALGNARRRYVLSDAHAPEGGFKMGDKLLFDFHSFPLRVKDDSSSHLGGVLKEGHLDAIYNQSWGGETPSGWQTENLPYLVEFDNYGISNDPGNSVDASHFVWGYDEISWFSLKSDEEKKTWLEYAYRWLNKTDPDGYLQMPTCRVVVNGISKPHKFKANKTSDFCKAGTNLELKIDELWNDRSNIY